MALLAFAMYIEGLLVSTVAVSFGALIKSKWLRVLALSIWPLAMPYLMYRLYLKYAGVITQLKDNPFLSAMLNSSQLTDLTNYSSLPSAEELSASPEAFTADDFDPDVDTNTKEMQGN